MGGIGTTDLDNSHPLATVVGCIRQKSTIHTRISLDPPPGLPVSPASLWIGDPPGDKDAHAIFSLHRLTAHEGQLFTFDTFEEFEPQSTLPTAGSVYRFVNWWMPDQLALARSDPQDLHRYLFEPRSYGSHDHCFLCWKTISDQPGDERVAYTNGSDTVCLDCYEKYIVSGFGKRLGDTV